MDEMVVYPWIAVREPLAVCGVEILPRDAAIAKAGKYADHVAAATSYFYDRYRQGAPEFGQPMTLVHMEPSVILPDPAVAQEQIESANLVWPFATIFTNNDFAYANATNFQHYYQRLGGEVGMFARRSRRMHGAVLDGTSAEYSLEVRPSWCGNYHDPDMDVLRLLESVVMRADARHIRECLDALRLATEDDDTEPADAEHAHYARAVERLLHRPGQTPTNRDGKQNKLCRELLRPFVAKPRFIPDVREAMRDQRNNFWHPEKNTGKQYPFEQQTAVRPNLIAFRAVSALVIAAAYNLTKQQPEANLAAYVRAVEEWISEIKMNDSREPQEVRDHYRTLWIRFRFQEQVANNPIIRQMVANMEAGAAK